MITIAISTFNRADVVATAVSSAIDFAAALEGEVIVVDDGSVDETASMLRDAFATAIAAGQLRIIRQQKNLGVTAAKNTGFEAAKPGWVLFLDSDDVLIRESAPEVAETLASHADVPIVFFRCIDESGRFVGQPFAEPQLLPLRRYLKHTSYGEALVSINKRITQAPPFDADLRGYEGLGCARIIKAHGPGLLPPVVARRYNRLRADRLSTRRNFLRRAGLVGRGHFRLIATFWRDMSIPLLGATLCKAVAYKAAGFAFSDGRKAE